MKQNNQQPKNEYQKILQKIESQSKQKKQERAINIMRGQSAKNKSYESVNYLQKLQNMWSEKRIQVGRYFRVPQNRHTAIITVFLVFSSYLCWTIQKKYDNLKKKANKTQTFKERQVQKQNEYIEKMLVPIPTELDEQNTYKFQQNDPKKGGYTIDTKQDLIDLIQKDVKDKNSAYGIYEEQLKRTQQRV